MITGDYHCDPRRRKVDGRIVNMSPDTLVRSKVATVTHPEPGV